MNNIFVLKRVIFIVTASANGICAVKCSVLVRNIKHTCVHNLLCSFLVRDMVCTVHAGKFICERRLIREEGFASRVSSHVRPGIQEWERFRLFPHNGWQLMEIGDYIYNCLQITIQYTHSPEILITCRCHYKPMIYGCPNSQLELYIASSLNESTLCSFSWLVWTVQNMCTHFTFNPLLHQFDTDLAVVYHSLPLINWIVFHIVYIQTRFHYIPI